ncbi:YadA-like family protein [Caballeronia sp. dw_19]|uniref:beta strand repeat-containing protein n=1 Tax=Caballeronia sp. dw_19 TaxID=2719791 RepID=UPI001BD1F266
MAIGQASVATGNNTVAVGSAAAPRKIVNLMAGSSTTDAVNYGQLQAAGLKVDTAGIATNAFVAYDNTALSSITLGGGTAGTKITNVAAGNVSSATSTDAVNGSQLYSTNQSVAANATAIAANAADIATNTAAIATNVGDIAQNTSDISTLNTQAADTVKYGGAAHDSITLDGTTGTKITNVAAGDVSSATSTDAVNGSQLYATNQSVAANTTAIAANTADIATNAAAISTNTTDISTLNTQAANAVKYASAAHNSITLDGTAGTKITNVAAGNISSATSMDAVNGAQLFHITDGTSVINSAYFKVSGANNGTDNAVLSSASGLAIGAGAQADTGDYTGTVAIGGGAVATAGGQYGSMAVGTATSASGGGTAVGYHASATLSSASLGKGASATAGYSTALGAGATASGYNSVAIGQASVATGNNTVAVGSAVAPRKIVNLMAGSSTTDAVNYGQLQAAGLKVDTAGIATNAFVAYDKTTLSSITLGGTTGTTITNVAAGNVSSATSTDAVNGSQLYATNQSVVANTTAIAANAADIATNTAAIATNVSDIAQNTSDISTINTQVGTLNTQIADAVKYDGAAHDSITLDGTTGTKITNVAAGDVSSATSTDAVNGSQLYATNQNVAQNTTAIVANTADIATNTSDIAQNTSDISTMNTQVGTLNTQIADAVKYDGAAHDSITLDGTTGTKITNVAAGDVSSATSTDAVNGSQLYATNQNVVANTTAIAANTADIATNATATATNTSDIATNTTAIAANTSDIAQNTSDISTINTQVGTLNTQIADAVKYDSAAHDSITLDGTAGTKITNVAAGDVSSATSTDAVNGSQLYATNQNVVANTTAIAANTADIATNTTAIAANTSDIAQNTSDISTINTQVGTLNTQIADAVKYDSATHDSITLDGTAGTKITNVAAGDVSSATSRDAVNGSQLYATNQNVVANTTAIAANTADIATNTTDIAQNTSDISTLNTQVADAVKYDSAAHDSITLDGPAGTKITNVAAGDISSATSTDAVNGSQLYATNQNVAQNATAIAANTSDISTLNTQMADTVKYDDAGHGSMTLGGSAGTVIKNVAAGQMTADSTEAVNGSQLFSVQQSVSDQGAALADSVRYDSSSHDTITLGNPGTPVALTNVKAGDVSASSLDAVNGSQLYTVTQNVTQNTTDIASLNVSMNNLNDGTAGLVRQDATTLALSVGANTGGGVISFAGLNGARVLTGVANGAVSSASSEAINGSQLFNASTSVATALGGGASVDANGGVTAPSYSVGGKQVSDVGSAVSNLDGRVTQNSADIAGIKGDLADVSKTAANAVAYDSADHSKVTLGGTDSSATVQLTNVAAGDLSDSSTDAVNGSQLGATNARVSATESAIANLEASGGGSTATGQDAAAMGTNADASGDNSTAAGSNAAASGSDSTAMGSNSTASGDNSTAAGANAAASGNDSTATGSNSTASGDNSTAAGAHSMASGDSSAAFGGNAAATADNAVAIGGNSQASGSNSMAMGANSIASGDNSVAIGANSVANEANTVSMGSAGNERRVTNVAPGVNGTDATNVNQLNALRNDVSSSLSSIERSAMSGVAAAMAMPNLMPSAPGKTVVGAGVANYKGYSAFAAGATYRSENSKWLMNAAVSVTPNGDTGVRAQAGYEF